MPINKSSPFTERASEAELIEVEKLLDELEAHANRWSKETHDRAFRFQSQKPMLKKVKRGKLKGASIITDPKKTTLKTGPMKGLSVTSPEGQSYQL